MIAVSVLLTVAGFFVLPESLVMQISATGNVGNMMPRTAGLLLPLAVSLIFSVMFYKSENDGKGRVGACIGMAAALFIYAFIYIFNLNIH